MVDALDLGRVGEHPGLLVEHQRVGRPSSSQSFERGLDELLGALVAEVVLEVLVVAEVQGLAWLSEVTMFHATRPLLTWSRLAKMRASSNG